MAQWKRILLGTTRLRVGSLASLSGLGIWCCRELWYRLQMQLRSHIAVALVQPLAWEHPYATGEALKSKNKHKNKKEKKIYLKDCFTKRFFGQR